MGSQGRNTEVVCHSLLQWTMFCQKSPHFEKMRDTKGTFHAKMSTIKDRNCMDLTEAENIKKWQVNTEKLYKRDFHDPDTMMV